MQAMQAKKMFMMKQNIAARDAAAGVEEV